jgi:hypothetical protein
MTKKKSLFTIGLATAAIAGVLGTATYFGLKSPAPEATSPQAGVKVAANGSGVPSADNAPLSTGLAPDQGGRRTSTSPSPNYTVAQATLSDASTPQVAQDIPITKIEDAKVLNVTPDQSCVNGRVLSADQLLEILERGVSAAGPNATEARLRALIQYDLTQSGTPDYVKTSVLAQLASRYQVGSAAQQAAASKYDLKGLEQVAFVTDGYDPCANPTATGNDGTGLFGNNLSAINPIPVLLSKSGSVSEGAPAL